MSIDITFDKSFTLADVEAKTSIKIEHRNKQYWMRKGDSIILIKTYHHTQKNLDEFKQDGFIIEEIDGERYATKTGSENIKIIVDDGKSNRVYGLSHYGLNSLQEIMVELVITFQTKFITDNEVEMFYYEPDLDVDKLYSDTTMKFGFEIIDGVIS